MGWQKWGKKMCPGLEWNGVRYMCRAYTKTRGEARKKVKDDVAIDSGCCSAINWDRATLLKQLVRVAIGILRRSGARVDLQMQP